MGQSSPFAGDAGPGEPAPGHVIHLPVAVSTLDAATELAALLAESLAFLPELDAGEVTVSAEDAQHERYRVFCDRLLFGSGRCGEREGHRGPCVAGAARPGPVRRTLIDATSGRVGASPPPGR
ncbi:hypothetical protein ACN27G_19840 [Plantactinospora sp. WMMB334]|uniref:hypothetical protein n=1 Tax=Plantactinospora sp. WMMB334 TaxID=3404119 RepID=UPI003B95E3F5